MGTFNYASKYSAKVDELFAKKAYSEIAVNNEYDWDGVKTVNVFSYPTVELGNYSKSGLSRYGTPEEVENEVQTMTLSQDKAFTFTIDRANRDDSMMTAEAGKLLAVEINQVVRPFVDKYTFGVMNTNAGNVLNLQAAPTKSNAYECVLALNELLDEDFVPEEGRILYVTPAFYNLIKLDPSFVGANTNSTNISGSGYVGDIDGLKVVKMPSTYFPTKVPFFITHPIATVRPMKLQTYNIHTNPVGVDGWIVEGRIYFDAFVLNNKVNAIGKAVTP